MLISSMVQMFLVIVRLLGLDVKIGLGGQIRGKKQERNQEKDGGGCQRSLIILESFWGESPRAAEAHYAFTPQSAMSMKRTFFAASPLRTPDLGHALSARWCCPTFSRLSAWGEFAQP